MSDDADAVMRDRIRQRLSAGLQTDWAQRALASDAVNRVCQRLQALPADDLDGKLVTAGFTLTPGADPTVADGLEQSCVNCMYFERHRRFCALPELMLPVEPRWSCLLWRI
jgi:hypothetical protein